MDCVSYMLMNEAMLDNLYLIFVGLNFLLFMYPRPQLLILYSSALSFTWLLVYQVTI